MLRSTRLGSILWILCSIAAAPSLAQETGDAVVLTALDDLVPDTPPDMPRPGVEHPTPVSSQAWTDRKFLTGNWYGYRTRLADRGIEAHADLTLDWAKNLEGINTSGSDTHFLLNANLTFDTERLFGLAGGTLFINYQEVSGDSASADSGLFQNPSNIDADNSRSQISELWYQQIFWNGKVRVKLGKVDANSEFDSSRYAAEFINASFGAPPGNPLMPSFPDPATSINVFVTPNERFYISGGVYDGSLAQGVQTGSYGPAHFLDSSDNLYLITEAGVMWGHGEGQLPGRLGIGGWTNTGTFTRFNGSDQDGVAGEYAIVDQALWRANPSDHEDERGIGAFVAYDGTDPRVFDVTQHIAGGLAWTGPLPSAARAKDVLGIAATYVIFTNANGAGIANDNELVLETFYKIQLLPYLSLKFDLQYSPDGGTDGQGPTLVQTVRLHMVF